MHGSKLPERFEIDFPERLVGSLVHLGRSEHYSAQWVLHEHTHGECMEICYLAKGCQAFKIDGKLYELNGGDILVTLPGTTHSSAGRAMERSVLYWLIIDFHENKERPFLDLPKQEAETIRRKLLALGNVLLHGNSQFQKNLDDIIQAYIMEQNHVTTRIRILLTDFLLNVIELGQFPAGRIISRPIISSINYIKQNVRENISLEALAEIVNLSLSRFKQKFRDEVGLGPREFILREKIKQAGKMLADGMKITQIANALSFSSSQYFATVFRRYLRMSPVKYRKLIPLYVQHQIKC